MFLQEPAQSPYDLRFNLLGIPIRVSWTFWIAAFVFGYGLARLMDQVLGADSLGLLPMLLVWSACLLVSIIIHELGHSLAFRRYGIESSIVLYHFGGMAIPGRSRTTDHSFGGLSPEQNIWISLAGPLAQLGSGVLIVVAVKLAGYRLFVFEIMPQVFKLIPSLVEGNAIDSPGLLILITFYIYPSILWALLNLLPVMPLDGGQVMRSVVQLSGGNILQALWVSVIIAGAVGFYGFSNGQTYLGILFLMLGWTNFQAIQQSNRMGY
ncbi:site-2 protease family protein [Rubripirellula sp.]|nr:site-2 protease family protein [Rubripirellula sp.]MDB4624530.1 site-2 protease family protein [Rubripirellula sp.]